LSLLLIRLHTPEFEEDGFLSNAKRFMNLRFGEQSSTGTLMRLSRNPSIWLLGIVGRKNGWFHQILEG
jgi:hypothetical protein